MAVETLQTSETVLQNVGTEREPVFFQFLPEIRPGRDFVDCDADVDDQGTTNTILSVPKGLSQ